jgi:hypothetical protein
MSETDQQATFMDQYANGMVMADEIDAFVDRWHESSLTTLGSLAEYLGMSADEYQAWVHDASVLPDIVRARRERSSLAGVMHR